MHYKSLDTKVSNGRDIGKPSEHAEDKKILLVDDEICILKTLSFFFENAGFKTTIASNGFDALNKFLRKPFDIVITDLNMKGMDGFSLIKKIKDRSPDTPVILITGESPNSVKKKEKNSKVDFILYKPFKVDAIEKLISNILEKDQKRSNLDIIYQ